jgi:hypothetical protein
VSGAGGAAVDCSLPPDSGSCLAAFSRWFYASSGLCEPFTWGGCEGNANNFESEAACLAACQGQSENDVTACAQPSDCVVEARRCCAAEPPSLETLVAVNTAHAGLRCAAVDCLPQVPDPDPARPWFGATCTDGHCRVIDARNLPIAKCTQISDCTLRNDLSCCGRCSAGTDAPIAVNLSAGFDDLFCGSEPVACDDCAPDYGAYVPMCIDGECRATILIETSGTPEGAR